jgi:hypothetical protein
MRLSTFKPIVLAAALLAPATTYAKAACTREDLNSAIDLYIAIQTEGSRAVLTSSFMRQPTSAGLRVPLRMGYSENFEVVDERIITKPMKIDRHVSLADATNCETFTEVIVADKSSPYALGSRLRVADGLLAEMEVIWMTTGYSGFNADQYLKQASAEDWGPIAAGKLDTRKTLESAANAYLDALLLGKASVEPWGRPCTRTFANGSCQVGLPVPTAIRTRRILSP